MNIRRSGAEDDENGGLQSAKGRTVVMKILAVHNFHRAGSASGDDQVFRSETSLLEKYGHEVIRYTVSNDDFDNAGAAGKLRNAFGMLWSFKNYRGVRALIREKRPDVMHVHTFFPLLSPSVLYAARKENVPVVATLHDTRFVCPCATSLRGTALCNECSDGHYFRMCRYKCFKGSGFQSFIVALIFRYHRMRGSFYRQIDRYICLNDNQIRLLTDAGFDKDKIVKKYNFVPASRGAAKGVPDTETAANGVPYAENAAKGAPDDITETASNVHKRKPAADGLPERYAVYYGRLGEEKGIRFLMKAWEDLDMPLVVMGAGPLEEAFREWADLRDNVFFLGFTEHEKCLGIVKGAEFVVFPSICYEGCSMVQIEAMSLGKAIIATDLGFSKESVKEGYNGLKFPLGDKEAFIRSVKALWNDHGKCVLMGGNAREEYRLKYTPEENYKALMAVYETAIGAKKGGGS